MKPTIALIHASRAAVDLVTVYYSQQAPEYELVNLLDDGVMRVLGAEDQSAARRRLGAMLRTAREEYSAALAVLTCSAVTRETLAALREAAGYPILKIDEPIARRAVDACSRIGVLATFPPTLATMRHLLEDAAQECGKNVEILEELAADALKALLSGDVARHDACLLASVERLAARSPDAIVLAQVSMARLAGEAARRAGRPVFSSLETSLAEVRRILAAS